MRKRTEELPETRVGNCCGCNRYPMPLFLVPGAGCRYRCADCFTTEVGYSHHLAITPNPRHDAASGELK